ncbi:hypothetical protein [Seonamhaeicola marinus]|uniref:DUF1795 domain-containing protein n=1 Tax=Seonamhaeicola marinus TaxID=1912246 RepID=A0A5D0HKR0_9FLAO|nr:hypothetical protein [Seonamhaeicola marinus]TYA71901.1 hypothetical protein FUA24_20335 [Seonamhaeicola marinus]
MKKCLVLFFVLLLNCSLVSFAQNGKWILKKDTKHAYRVYFPFEPVAQETNVPTAKGDITMYSYTVNDEKETTKNFIYMTATSDYPESWFPEGLNTPEKENNVLKGCVDGAVSNVKGVLQYSKDISLNGYSGKKARIIITSGGANYIINLKCFLVGYKVYILQTISTEQNQDNTDIDRFFNSFELINIRS